MSRRILHVFNFNSGVTITVWWNYQLLKHGAEWRNVEGVNLAVIEPTSREAIRGLRVKVKRHFDPDFDKAMARINGERESLIDMLKRSADMLKNMKPQSDLNRIYVNSATAEALTKLGGLSPSTIIIDDNIPVKAFTTLETRNIFSTTIGKKLYEK